MSREVLGVALRCDACGVYFCPDGVEREAMHGVGWPFIETARVAAIADGGWLVNVREMRVAGHNGKSQPSYTLRDFCAKCCKSVVLTNGVIAPADAVVPSMPHVQRKVLTVLAGASPRQWTRGKEIDDDLSVSGALAALVVKGWAERRERRSGRGVRVMYEYRATKAGRVELAKLKAAS